MQRPAALLEPSERGRELDLADQLADFVHRYPAWIDPRTHAPWSWKLYVLGARAMWRANAREMLRTASASGVGMATKEERERWHVRMKAAAGER